MKHDNLFSRMGIILLVVLLALSIFAVPVLAATDTNTPRTGVLSVDAKKKVELAIINTTINLLNISMASASGLATISPESAQETVAFINSMIATLDDFETQVNSATTIEELNQINTDLKAYLIESKDEYRAQLHSIVAAFADDAYVKATQYIAIADATLSAYQIKCPGQSASIDNVQGQLAELETAAAALNASIQASDAVGMKAGVKEVSSLMISITAQLTALDSAISSGIDTTCKAY